MPNGFGIPGHHINFRPTGPVSPAFSGTGNITLVDTTSTQTLTGKTFTDPVITNTPVSVTAATVTIGAATHANKTVVLNRATGIAATLPLATGTGNRYEFVIGASFTGAATIVTGQVTDVLAGNAILHDTDDATVHGFSTTNATTLTLYGASNATGGLRGGRVMLVDVATNLWIAEYQSNAASSPSTPFS